MSSASPPLDVAMNTQWFGWSARQNSSKVVGGKVPDPVVKEEVRAALDAVVDDGKDETKAAEEIMPVDSTKDDLEPDDTGSKGLWAKLGVPVAAAVAVWAVIAKSQG